MAIKNREISKELENQLRAVSFSSPNQPINESEVHMDETTAADDPEVVPDTPIPAPILKKPFLLNKRVVTLEYLDKLEKSTAASAKYESIKEFSHTISNLSIVLLSISIILYVIIYFINPHSISLTSLVILSIQAFALLGLTLYSMAQASTHKQVRDILISDFSTCSQAIGNPRAEAYIPMDTPDILN